jgi:kynureninase
VITDRDHAAGLDRDDPLAGFRDRFIIDPDIIYLDGNSLGCLPVATAERLSQVVSEQWGRRGIRGWTEGWLELPVHVGDRLGAELLGAAPGQVVIGESTTVCLYKLFSAALDARPGRREILTDRHNFPTDRYVLEGLAAARGLSIRWLDPPGDGGVEPEDVAAAVSQETALVTFSHVSYRSAHIADMATINAIAHGAGALVLWDLCHTAGSVPVELDAAGTDLAAGCTYKYLNAGPGAPAFMYMRRELQGELRQPIWGWLGRRDPFEMAQGYEPAAGAGALLSGTPPVLALTGVQEGVGIVAEAGIDAIRAKGIALTELAIALIDEWLAPLGACVASPRDAARRGAHVALAHPDAEALSGRLLQRGVIIDFRRPDVIRLGLSPLTTRFVDVWDGLAVARELLS